MKLTKRDLFKGKAFDTENGSVKILKTFKHKIIFHTEADGKRSPGILPTEEFLALVQPPDLYEYSSTQVDLPASIADRIKEFGASIPDKELAAYGRELGSHITVLYGTHTDDPNELVKSLVGEPPISVTLGKVSVFPADEKDVARGGSDVSDVIKVGIVDSPDIHRLNAKLSGLAHTNSFPIYQPHATIAYVNPGNGKKYDGVELPGVTGKSISFDSVSFHGKDGKRTRILLLGTKEKAGNLAG